LVLDEVQERVPVYVHTGDYFTQTTIELSGHAKEIGADGVMILLPYCMNPSWFQLLNHFRFIAEKVNIPIIIYDNPWDTGITISSNDIQKLVKGSSVVAVKLTHKNPCEVHNLKYLNVVTKSQYFTVRTTVSLRLFFVALMDGSPVSIT